MLATKAAGDEAALGKLIGDPGIPDEVLGFHAQQAVEKLIKAVLTFNQTAPPRTHDIGYLITLLEENELPLPPRHDDLQALSPWVAEFRYEATFEKHLDRGDIQDLVAAVRTWADRLMAAG